MTKSTGRDARSHDGPEQMLQSKAGYIDARPLTASSAKPLATHGRTIHQGQSRPFLRDGVTSELLLTADIGRSKQGRLNRHDGFALLFEHVPARIDARHTFVVMVQKRLDEVDRQTCRLRNRRSRSPKIMGRKRREAVVFHDTADGLAQRMTGKRLDAFKTASENR